MLIIVLLIAAFLCFIGAAADIPNGKSVNLIGLGLAFWILTLLIGK